MIVDNFWDEWKAGMSVKMACQQQLSALRKKDEGIFFSNEVYFSQLFSDLQKPWNL